MYVIYEILSLSSTWEWSLGTEPIPTSISHLLKAVSESLILNKHPIKEKKTVKKPFKVNNYQQNF